jgi:hypothetical protein
MKRLLITIALGFAVPCLLLAQPKSAPSANNPLQGLADILLGRWLGDVTFAADYPGIGKKGEKVSGYDIYRWSVDGMTIENESFFGKTTGKSLIVWDAATKQIRFFGVDSGGNYSTGTLTFQGAKLAWSSAGSLADGQKVEYKGETTFADNGNTRIEAGVTILGGVSNPFRDVYKRIVKQ